MKRRKFIGITSTTFVGMNLPLSSSNAMSMSVENNKRKILIFGGGYNQTFIPTASADNPFGIANWFETCAPLDVKPFVQRMFISSYNQKVSFEEVLLSMDGIVVGGGNTLNMMAIWKAQGIDTILRQAWDKGIVLAGGSAGSLCWFEHGTTDSRPKDISKVECLGFIKGSHCPHYDSEPTRRPLSLVYKVQRI
jgi:peptidase E